jgi:hypothetical protein
MVHVRAKAEEFLPEAVAILGVAGSSPATG